MGRYIDHYKGERKQDRPTPKLFFEELHSKYRFTLDGAASAEDALLPRFSSESNPVSWKGERVFCNPPWSNIRPFVEQIPDPEFVCFLVPARANCKWFHRALDLGAHPEFFKPKLNFGGKWNSPVDCVLLIRGTSRAMAG